MVTSCSPAGGHPHERLVCAWWGPLTEAPDASTSAGLRLIADIWRPARTGSDRVSETRSRSGGRSTPCVLTDEPLADAQGGDVSVVSVALAGRTGASPTEYTPWR